MERMEKRTNFVDFIDRIQRQDRYIKELEEENKNLNEEIENHKQNIMQDELEIIPKLEEENKNLNKKIEKLQIEIGGLMGERDGKQMRIQQLKEENKKLETKLKKWEKALIKLCLKNDYSIIIIDGEEVFNMDNYKIEKKKKPENQKLF